MLPPSLARIDMVGSRLGPNGLSFSGDILVNIQVVTFLLLSSVSELNNILVN